ncbi:hypothetical protein BYT27DRAFT_7188751, partial [Phlegmacium glaucopus]
MGLLSRFWILVFATNMIGGKEWVAPHDVRACFTSVKVDENIKANIIEVINKTLAFHTSVNDQILAPEPTINFDLHIGLSRTLKHLNDGHCVWINSSLFLDFLPTPLTDSDGSQNVHISPEAFQVASVEFTDEIDVWQDALPGALKGKLASLSGAKVLESYPVFSSYSRGATGWNYILGNFSQQSLPPSDSVTLKLQLVGQPTPVNVVLPYRSRFGATSVNFTELLGVLITALRGTNGSSPTTSSSNAPFMKFQQQPSIPAQVGGRKPSLNVVLDTAPPSDVVLPPPLQPALPTLNGSRSVSQFYLLNDGKTGVMALGSFSDSDFHAFLLGMLQGLTSLKSSGATQPIVDLSNNGGGSICAAHWLYRIIVSPKSTSVPQAGLDTKARDGPLAQLIVKKSVDANADPQQLLFSNPTNWPNASNFFFAATDDWLLPPVLITVDDRPDSFGEECAPNGFPSAPPDTVLFDPSKVVLVSKGETTWRRNLEASKRCASSCSLFSITMAKEEKSKTVLYCGTVGVQGIAWRLAFGIDNPTQPE